MLLVWDGTFCSAPGGRKATEVGPGQGGTASVGPWEGVPKRVGAGDLQTQKARCRDIPGGRWTQQAPPAPPFSARLPSWAGSQMPPVFGGQDLKRAPPVPSLPPSSLRPPLLPVLRRHAKGARPWGGAPADGPIKRGGSESAATGPLASPRPSWDGALLCPVGSARPAEGPEGPDLKHPARHSLRVTELPGRPGLGA